MEITSVVFLGEVSYRGKIAKAFRKIREDGKWIFCLCTDQVEINFPSCV